MSAGGGRSLAVTSGKGGVGKSVVALNLGLSLARQGQRVLLVDADLGLGNLALLMGLGPEHTLEEVLRGACEPEAAVLEGPADTALLPSGSGLGADPWDSLTVAPEAIEGLSALENRFDWIVIDTGAGIAAKVQDFVLAADETLLLATPEPTAIADAYATAKVLLAQRPELPVGLLVSMAESAAEAATLQTRFAELAARFLGAEIDNRGYIPLDRYVREAAKRQTPLVLAEPPSPAAQAFARLAGELVSPGPRRADRGYFERLGWRRAAAPSPSSSPG